MKNFLKILLGVLLAGTVAVIGYAVYVAATVGSDAVSMAPAVDLNLYWAYALVAVVILATIINVIYGMIKSSKGALKSIISFVAVIAIIAGAYFIAAGHSIQIPNIENGGVFEQGETVVTETSVLIAYVAMAGTVLAAIFSEVMNAFK